MKANAIWRRLDTPGHDAAQLVRANPGWKLEGTAIFVQNSEPARLTYEVELNTTWETLRGSVRGFIGDARIDDTIVRDASGWTLNGARVPGLDQLVDLDFGFTPATNLPQLRRLDLNPGEAADFHVAWFDAGASTLVALRQRYQRQDERTYWYESPSVSYQAVLEMAPNGFARTYPTLWVLEC